MPTLRKTFLNMSGGGFRHCSVYMTIMRSNVKDTHNKTLKALGIVWQIIFSKHVFTNINCMTTLGHQALITFVCVVRSCCLTMLLDPYYMNLLLDHVA